MKGKMKYGILALIIISLVLISSCITGSPGKSQTYGGYDTKELCDKEISNTLKIGKWHDCGVAVPSYVPTKITPVGLQTGECYQKPDDNLYYFICRTEGKVGYLT